MLGLSGGTFGQLIASGQLFLAIKLIASFTYQIQSAGELSSVEFPDWVQVKAKHCNQSFVSVIPIILSQISLKPLTFEASSTFFLANRLHSYIFHQNRFCMRKSKEVILQ